MIYCFNMKMAIKVMESLLNFTQKKEKKAMERV
jgi:hypothetical protein